MAAASLNGAVGLPARIGAAEAMHPRLGEISETITARHVPEHLTSLRYRNHAIVI
jgi:hypothetical protein